MPYTGILYYLSGLNIELSNADTGEILDIAYENSNLTAFNRELRQQMLLGNTSSYNINDLDIKYFAFGDDDTAFNPNDTTLYNEVYRKQVTAKSESGNIVTSLCVLNSTQANFNIKEIGIFAGDSATGTADSGNMLSRVVVDYNKNENIILNVYRYDITVI